MKTTISSVQGSAANIQCPVLNQSPYKGMSTQWIMVYQVMQRLGISRSTVYRWVQRGYLHAYQFEGSHIQYFDADEIDQIIRSNAILPSKRFDETALMK